MGSQKRKKGPARKLPKRRHAEARVLEEPQYRPRIVRQRRYDERCEDSYHRLDDDYD